ncbi:MAG TPA: hypothetical protein VK524_09600 [Polyangiaceae bacterium]|nr:hypothetical protein [Polyangiaceae bacterium]
MATLSSLKFVLKSSAGAHELVVDSSRALVGSGPHCEIRLPAEEAGVEQLLVEAGSGGVFAQARCLNPPALLNGLPFTEGRLLPDSVLEIGGTKLSVSLAQSDLQRDPGTSKKRGRLSPIHVLGLIGFPVGIFMISAGPRQGAAEEEAPSPPVLFASDSKAVCPQPGGAQAAELGRDELALADAQRERSPFYAEDGVSAVAHYQRATACFRVGGADAEARQAEQSAVQLKHTLKEQFHVHQVRLEHAALTGEFERARTEIQMLLSFVAAEPGEYGSWLTMLDRRIQLKYTGEKAKKP